MKKKTAVILFSIGGPDSKESIAPFLYNFFSDPAIIPMPRPFRHLLAWLIAKRRAAGEAGENYAKIGYKSPLLDNTLKQAEALEAGLELTGDECSYRSFVCMRYWHPRASEVVEKVMSFNPDRIVLLPMYPQFSCTTTGSSFNEWYRESANAGMDIPVFEISCYPVNEGFVRSCANSVKKTYEDVVKKHTTAPKILLSAHGLPEYVIKRGDPYQAQCEQTARAIMDATGYSGTDWSLCYQSRVGPARWIGPDTREEILKAARAGRPVVIFTPAFVSDHIETLVEIDIEYREFAVQNGAPCLVRAPVPGTDGDFIGGLAEMVRASVVAGEKSQ